MANSNPTKPVRGKDSGERRVEVRITVDKTGGRQVVLQDMSFGSGVGWYTQKSIHLDQQQVEALMGALCACRQIAQRDSDTACPAGARDATKNPNRTREARILTFPR